MDITERIRLNPPQGVNSMEETETYWSLLDAIKENGTQLQYGDRYALGELAVIICEVNRLRQDLLENGEQIEVQGDRNMVTKKNASRDALTKLQPQLLRLYKEFKLTPASRGSKDFGSGPTNPNDDFGKI